MPTVPYKPIPDQSPQATPTPYFHVNTPPAAFGANIGQALEGLGQMTEHAGNELFTRAIALQNLRNETEAREADAQYMMKAGELHANFSSLQGKQAVDAYPGYMQQLQESREQIREGLSNDASRRLYDSPSLSTLGRTIFNGAGHAAAENKSWAYGASKARIGAMADTALSSPNDDLQ